MITTPKDKKINVGCNDYSKNNNINLYSYSERLAFIDTLQQQKNQKLQTIKKIKAFKNGQKHNTIKFIQTIAKANALSYIQTIQDHKKIIGKNHPKEKNLLLYKQTLYNHNFKKPYKLFWNSSLNTKFIENLITNKTHLYETYKTFNIQKEVFGINQDKYNFQDYDLFINLKYYTQNLNKSIREIEKKLKLLYRSLEIKKNDRK